MQTIPTKTYTAIGMMSGTSLDGLDLVLCRFNHLSGRWRYEILKAETIPYSGDWIKLLSSAHKLDEVQLSGLHKIYGEFLGMKILDFISGKSDIDFIASHGHTVFHEPKKGITFQLGDGKKIAGVTGIPVIWDFRSEDVALGGQGAPLVPVGDKFLFGEYKFCLNLGGFSNISFDRHNKRIAFDICPVNFVLNKISSQLDMKYDEDGKTASSGINHSPLLKELNSLPYYLLNPPKSLGREWAEQNFFPVLEKYDISSANKLRTVCEHISHQLVQATADHEEGNILVTGGGANNSFLIELFRKKTKHQVVIPDKQLVDFKEALVFAFLGLLRILKIPNCYASVTGASKDSCAGTYSHP